jgi:hypothetical protein
VALKRAGASFGPAPWFRAAGAFLSRNWTAVNAYPMLRPGIGNAAAYLETISARQFFLPEGKHRRKSIGSPIGLSATVRPTRLMGGDRRTSGLSQGRLRNISSSG